MSSTFSFGNPTIGNNNFSFNTNIFNKGNNIGSTNNIPKIEFVQQQQNGEYKLCNVPAADSNSIVKPNIIETQQNISTTATKNEYTEQLETIAKTASLVAFMDDDPFGVQKMNTSQNNLNSNEKKDDNIPRVVTPIDILAKVRSQYSIQYRPLPSKINIMEITLPWEQLQTTTNIDNTTTSDQNCSNSVSCIDDDNTDIYVAMNTLFLSPTVSLDTVQSQNSLLNSPLLMYLCASSSPCTCACGCIHCDSSSKTF